MSYADAANWTIGSAGQLNAAAQAAPASPADGDIWHDSTQGVLASGQGGLTVYRPGLLYSQTTNVTLTASGNQSLVDTTGAVGTLTLPANWWAAGRRLRISWGGYYTTLASTPGNFRTWATFGASQYVVPTAVLGLQTSVANDVWTSHADLVCKAIGTSGLFDGFGFYDLHKSGALYTVGLCNGTAITSPSPNTQLSYDTTTSMTFDVQIGPTTAGNSFTLAYLILETWG